MASKPPDGLTDREALLLSYSVNMAGAARIRGITPMAEGAVTSFDSFCARIRGLLRELHTEGMGKAGRGSATEAMKAFVDRGLAIVGEANWVADDDTAKAWASRKGGAEEPEEVLLRKMGGVVESMVIRMSRETNDHEELLFAFRNMLDDAIEYKSPLLMNMLIKYVNDLPDTDPKAIREVALAYANARERVPRHISLPDYLFGEMFPDEEIPGVQMLMAVMSGDDGPLIEGNKRMRCNAMWVEITRAAREVVGEDAEAGENARRWLADIGFSDRWVNLVYKAIGMPWLA